MTPAGAIEIRGPVAGHVQAAGGEVLVDSAVAGNVRVAAGQLRLGPNARIGGRVIMRGAERVRQDPAARVAGGVTREPARTRELRYNAWKGMSWAWKFWWSEPKLEEPSVSSRLICSRSIPKPWTTTMSSQV